MPWTAVTSQRLTFWDWLLLYLHNITDLYHSYNVIQAIHLYQPLTDTEHPYPHHWTKWFICGCWCCCCYYFGCYLIAGWTPLNVLPKILPFHLWDDRVALCRNMPHNHLLDFVYFLEDMTCHCKTSELSFSFDYSVNFLFKLEQITWGNGNFCWPIIFFLIFQSADCYTNASVTSVVAPLTKWRVGALQAFEDKKDVAENYRVQYHNSNC